MRFVIDEDMPRSLGPALVAAGHEAWDVRDHGLRGKGDAAVFGFAQEQTCALISEDLGFGNLLKFPIGTHHGIVVGRFPLDAEHATRGRRDPSCDRTLHD